MAATVVRRPMWTKKPWCRPWSSGRALGRSLGPRCVLLQCWPLHRYRLLDTASIYSNHHMLGRAILRSAVPRREILVSTKVSALPPTLEETSVCSGAPRRRAAAQCRRLWSQTSLLARREGPGHCPSVSHGGGGRRGADSHTSASPTARPLEKLLRDAVSAMGDAPIDILYVHSHRRLLPHAE
jgi:aryl-alcohol dehydrogenase-like predicted oxidoreductase